MRPIIQLIGMLYLVIAFGCSQAEPEETKDLSQIKSSLMEMPNAMDPREVDLGVYDITITESTTNSTLMVDFHAFAQMPNYKQEEFIDIMDDYKSRIRNEIILKIRGFDRSHLNEPDLDSVRAAIGDAVKKHIDSPTFDKVGFYHFRFLEE